MSDSATSNDSTSDQQPELFYQAIGTVEGILQQNDEDWTLAIGEQSFRAWINPKQSFFKRIELGTLQRFRVYPTYTSRFGFSFRIINLLPPDDPLGLILRGCWSVRVYFR